MGIGNQEWLFGGKIKESSTPLSLREIQQKVVDWHEQRFSDPKPWFMTMKIQEELGELASAVNALYGTKSATGSGDVAGEAADVLITLLALLGVAFPEIDLESEVDAKLAILNDKNSTHRASLS